jgi:hypothetical protein
MLLVLCKQMKMKKEFQQSILVGFNLNPTNVDLLHSNSHPADLPPPSKFARRRKTPCTPPKGPSCSQMGTESTTTSMSGPNDENDSNLEFPMNSRKNLSFHFQ